MQSTHIHDQVTTKPSTASKIDQRLITIIAQCYSIHAQYSRAQFCKKFKVFK